MEFFQSEWITPTTFSSTNNIGMMMRIEGILKAAFGMCLLTNVTQVPGIIVKKVKLYNNSFLLNMFLQELNNLIIMSLVFGIWFSPKEISVTILWIE